MAFDDVKNVGKITINGTSLPLMGSPYIGTNGNWWVWNTDTQQYQDSGYSAVTTGRQGIQGVGISPSNINVIETGDDAGKLEFTLYDPATATTQTIKTTHSVQGVGISGVSVNNNRQLQITFINPITGEPPSTPSTFTTANTVIPAVTAGAPNTQTLTAVEEFVGDGETTVFTLNRHARGLVSVTVDGTEVVGATLGDYTIFLEPAPEDGAEIRVEYTYIDDRQFTVDVGGTVYTSPILQGVGIDNSIAPNIGNDGKLTLHLINPFDGVPSTITTDKTIQGVGVTNVVINNRKFVFTLTNPITQGTESITVQDDVVPEFTWVSKDKNSVNRFIGNGTTTVYSLSFVPKSNSVSVTIDGTVVDNYIVSNDVVTFSDAPASGTEIIISYVYTDTSYLNTNIAGTDIESASLRGPQGYQGALITAVHVDTESVDPGELTVTVYDPTNGTSSNLVASGRVWGPQGYQGKGISAVSVTSDNKIVLTIHDPATGGDTTVTSADTITAVGTGIKMSTTDDTTVQSAISTNADNISTNASHIGTLSNLSTSAKTDIVSAINELYATSPIHIASAAPTTSATDVQKRKLWVNTSTGISYIWTGSAWMALGAVWK